MNNELEKKIDEIDQKIYGKCHNIKYNSISHYTSPFGLDGILANKTLRFTHVDYLNDSSEGKYIYEVLEDCLREKEYDEEFVKIVNEICLGKVDLYEEYVRILNGKKSRFYESITSKYICCFSLHDDSVGMWNYYTKDEKKIGYNLTIDVRKTKEKINKNKSKEESIQFGLYSFPICYNKSEQKERINYLLEKYQKVWLDNKEYGEDIVLSLAILLDFLKLSFKHYSYQYEQEYRFVLCFQKKLEEQLIMNDKIKFELRHGYYVPYIDMNCIDEESLLKIRISPFGKDEIVKWSLLQKLKTVNLDRVTIENSDAPCRY